MEHARKHAGESSIRDRIGRNGVHRPANGMVFDCVTNHGDNFVERDPAHPLPPVAEPPAGAQAKWNEDALERAAIRRENDSETQHQRANAQALGLRDFRFPVTADLRKKIIARRGGFGERFVAAITVIANGRSRNEHARLLFQLRKARDKMAGRVDAAAAQNLFARGRPPAVGDGRAGQMHERVGAFQRMFSAAGPDCEGEPERTSRAMEWPSARSEFTSALPTMPDEPEMRIFTPRSLVVRLSVAAPSLHRRAHELRLRYGVIVRASRSAALRSFAHEYRWNDGH